jgi:hypothetical protein
MVSSGHSPRLPNDNVDGTEKTGRSCTLQTKQLLRTVRAGAGTRRKLQHVSFFFQVNLQYAADTL